MTTKKNGATINLNRLKLLLAAGSLVAAMWGADLLAQADRTPPPASREQQVELNHEDPTLPEWADLAPIPELAIPETITQSRSSA